MGLGTGSELPESFAIFFDGRPLLDNNVVLLLLAVSYVLFGWNFMTFGLTGILLAPFLLLLS